MEVNKHINFLKRRGFLIKESSQIELSFDEPVEEGLNFKSLCAEGSDVFCRLLQLADREGIKNDEYLSNKLVKSITKIFTYLKPPIKDNRSKFNRLVTVILNQNLENSINTFDIIADAIDDVNIGKLRQSINRLTDSQIELGDEALLKIINNIKHQSYTKYENSFIGDHFESFKTRLELSYKGEEVLNFKFAELLLDYLDNGKDYNELSNMLYKAVINNFKKGIGKFIKADLKCTKPLTDGRVTIINRGDYVEVKKLDYKGDSYLSEFFSIYKSPKKLPKRLKTPEGVNLYNQVIDSLFLKLNNNDYGIIESIGGSFAGIIYDENRFIPKEDIEIYWSNKGQRTEDHRLSIRYRLKSNNFHSYTYSTDSDILKPEIINTEITSQNIMLPLTVNESITEASVTDRHGKEWDRNSTQGKMIRTKGGTKELDDDFDWAIQQAEITPDDPKIEALIQHFDGVTSEVIGEGFNEDAGDWYGHHTVMELQNGEEWVVGTYTSMGNALHEYMTNYVDDVGVEELGIDLSDFVDVGDYWISQFCQEETDHYFDDMTDEDLLEVYGDYDIVAEIEELEEKEENLKEELIEVEEKLRQYLEAFETMEIQNQEYISYGYERPQHSEEDFENIQNKIDKFQHIVGKIKHKLDYEMGESRDEYLETLRDQSKDDYTDECERCMERDPVDCIVNEKGWYRTGAEAIEAFGWDLDKDAIVQYLSEDGYDSMASYDGYAHEEYVDGETYVLIRVN